MKIFRPIVQSSHQCFKTLINDVLSQGRITEVRPGTSQHAIAVKCYYHGCSVLKTAKAFTGNVKGSYDRLMNWLHQGSTLAPHRTDKKGHTNLYSVAWLSGNRSVQHWLCGLNNTSLRHLQPSGQLFLTQTVWLMLSDTAQHIITDLLFQENSYDPYLLILYSFDSDSYMIWIIW